MAATIPTRIAITMTAIRKTLPAGYELAYVPPNDAELVDAAISLVRSDRKDDPLYELQLGIGYACLNRYEGEGNDFGCYHLIEGVSLPKAAERLIEEIAKLPAIQ